MPCQQRLGAHKKLGGDTARTADPNEHTILLHAQYINWGELAGGHHGTGIDWALVSKW